MKTFTDYHSPLIDSLTISRIFFLRKEGVAQGMKLEPCEFGLQIVPQTFADRLKEKVRRWRMP